MEKDIPVITTVANISEQNEVGTQDENANYSDKNIKIKKPILLGVAIAILAIILVIIFVLSHQSYQPSENNARQLAFEYLNTKYGDGDWQIHENIRDAGYTLDGFVKHEYDNGYIFRVTSSYTNDVSFIVDVDDVGMITTDSFLPTYYSIKYDFDYTAPTEGNMTGKYDELIKKMVYVTDYHYPYNDYKYSSSGPLLQRPKARIHSFEMASFYNPIHIERSPEHSKILDVIPNDAKIPEIMTIINAVEDYYSSGLIKNRDKHEAELFSLIFEEKASDEMIESFITDHIVPVDGYEPMSQYEKK